MTDTERFTAAAIDTLTRNVKLTLEQLTDIGQITTHARAMAELILQRVPESIDRSTAIARLESSILWAAMAMSRAKPEAVGP